MDEITYRDNVGGALVPGDTYRKYKAMNPWGIEINRLVYTRYLTAAAGTAVAEHVRNVYQWNGQNSVPTEQTLDATVSEITYRQGPGADMRLIAGSSLWKAWSVTDLEPAPPEE